MLPVFRRFSIGDYPNAPDWLGQMFNPLNTFSETTVQTLNKNLVIGNNVQGQIFTTIFTTDANYATGTFSEIVLSYSGGGQPKTCILGNISPTDGTMILNPVSISSWYLNINTNPAQVTIKYIAGLQPSAKYNAVFLVL